MPTQSNVAHRRRRTCKLARKDLHPSGSPFAGPVSSATLKDAALAQRTRNDYHATLVGRCVFNAVQRPPLELAIGEGRYAEADDLRSDGQLDVKVVMHDHFAILTTQHNACQR